MIPTQIRYAKTLEYHGGIKVFEAKDPIGGTYLASMLEARPDADRYLVVGCEPEQLSLFRNGGTDLRSLITRSAVYGWFLADVTDYEEPLNVTPQIPDAIPDDYLPRSGFFINQVDIDHEITARARERDNIIIQVSISPPEASDGSRVRAQTLRNLIEHVQTLARCAVEEVRENQEQERPRSRRDRDAHLLDAIELAAGSTVLTLQGASRPDPNGESLLSKGLEQLDYLFKHGDTPDRAAEALTKYHPKMAQAYLSLMKFLRASKTGFSYTWTTPRRTGLSHQAVPLGKAQILAKELERILPQPDDQPMEVVLEGRLEMADQPKNRWRLRDHRMGARQGTVGEDGPTLSHLVIDREYRFECLEKTPTKGKATLYLQSITELDQPPARRSSS